ncbi:hypothetical protein BGZ73_001736 [Actinomortierella ambigua]|nr:hypothetical protein BGZ73_001736 [Actinomortierella ambigua]
MASTSPSGSPRPPKQRLMRHRPFYQRWMQAPEDWYLRFLSSVEAVDWDLIQDALSYPIVVGLNALMISVNLGYWFDDPMSNVPTILRSASSSSSPYQSKPLIPGFAALLTYLKSILVAISFLNTERPPTTNVRMVEIQQDTSHWSTRFPGRLLYPFYVLLFRRRPLQLQTIKVWEMSVWNPSVLSRNIFCGFSPAQVLIMAAMDESNFYLFAPLALFVAIQVYYLTHMYQAYLKDKQILFSEVYREYDRRFVNPRLFVRKYDKQVSVGSSSMANSDDDMEEEEDEWKEEEEEDVFDSHTADTEGGARCRFRGRRVPSYWPKLRRPQNEEEEEQEEEEEEEDDDYNVDEGEEDDEEEQDEGEYKPPRIPHPTNALAFSDEDEDE